jgi:S-adenosylmethionine/arginine decarboxylase-like enzyme
MENLAPHITRQRLIIEGFYQIEVDRETIKQFFNELTKELRLRTYGEPTIFSPDGKGKDINQGFDAFVPLIDSGISIYVWSPDKFLSLIIFTCKKFDEKAAIEFTKKFFKIKKAVKQSF